MTRPLFVKDVVLQDVEHVEGNPLNDHPQVIKDRDHSVLETYFYRYNVGAEDAHLHFRLGRSLLGRKGPVDYFCAVIGVGTGPHADSLPAYKHQTDDTHHGELQSHEFSMLVRVIQEGEDSERVQLPLLVRSEAGMRGRESSVVRLQTLEECENLETHVLNVGQVAFPRFVVVADEVPGIIGLPNVRDLDREGDAVAPARSEGDAEVVEGGPKIVHDVSEDQRRLVVGLLKDVEREAIGVRIRFTPVPPPDPIRIAAQVHPEVLFEVFEVLFCPSVLQTPRGAREVPV